MAILEFCDLRAEIEAKQESTFATNVSVLAGPGHCELPPPKVFLFEQTTADPPIRAHAQTVFHYPSYFQADIDRAKILGHNIIAKDDRFIHDKLISEKSAWTWAAAQNDIVLVTNNSVESQRIDSTPIRVPGVAALIDSTSGYNYHHWLIDCLPLLEASARDSRPVDTFLISSRISQSLLRIGTYFGLDMERVRPFAGGGSGVIQTDTLRYASPLNVLNRWVRPELLQFLRKVIPRALQDAGTGLGRKIYLSRLDAGRSMRELMNEHALAQMLESRGFRVVKMSEHNFLEQVAIVHCADVIIGLHGAAVANIIFARSGTQLLLLEHEYKGYVFYRQICAMLDVGYSCVVGDTLFNPTSLNHNQNQNWIIDIEKVARAIDTIEG